jgi:hypothetical protein
LSDIPSQPKKSGAYYGALTAVIILSTLIVLALIALVVGAARLMWRHTAPPVPQQGFVLPRGATVTTTESQPGRLILHVHGPAGDEIDIVDTVSGKLVSRIKTK